MCGVPPEAAPNRICPGFSFASLIRSATVFAGSDNAHAGWTVGAGVEASLGGNWTGKIEYLYMDLGRFNTNTVLLTNTPPIGATYSSRITDNIVRAGINYRFGGPVVARY